VFITERAEVVVSRVGDENLGYSYDWTATLNRTVTVSENYDLPDDQVDVAIKWTKTGNVIKLLFGDVVWREYDISGIA
jgi:hypothetical protein